MLRRLNVTRNHLGCHSNFLGCHSFRILCSILFCLLKQRGNSPWLVFHIGWSISIFEWSPLSDMLSNSLEIIDRVLFRIVLQNPRVNNTNSFGV